MKSLQLSSSKSRCLHALIALLCLPIMGGCDSAPSSQAQGTNGSQDEDEVRVVPFEVVKAYPHDRNAWTQGLLWHDGELYESTGLNGKSTLRRVDLKTGRVLQQHRLPNEIFGEGLALANENLVQISWKNQRAFVYDLKTFKPRKEWNYEGEGWGLTFDGKHLIMSDGGSHLSFRDPKTFEEVRRVEVTVKGEPQLNLNELEWIEGEIWANVWQTEYIVRIDPQSGKITSMLDCTGLSGRKIREGEENVLNGIAYDKDNKRIFLTGKLWPRLYEIKLLKPPAQ